MTDVINLQKIYSCIRKIREDAATEKGIVLDTKLSQYKEIEKNWWYTKNTIAGRSLMVNQTSKYLNTKYMICNKIKEIKMELFFNKVKEEYTDYVLTTMIANEYKQKTHYSRRALTASAITTSNMSTIIHNNISGTGTVSIKNKDRRDVIIDPAVNVYQIGKCLHTIKQRNPVISIAKEKYLKGDPSMREHLPRRKRPLMVDVNAVLGAGKTNTNILLKRRKMPDTFATSVAAASIESYRQLEVCERCHRNEIKISDDCLRINSIIYDKEFFHVIGSK